MTTVERVAGAGWTLDDQRSEVPGYKEKKRAQQSRSIDRILEVMKIDVGKTPIKITVGGTLLAGSGGGRQRGELRVAGPCPRRRVRARASDRGDQQDRLAGQFPYHGVASGVDNTASTYGGLLRFHLKDKQQHFEAIGTPAPFEIVLANSGVTWTRRRWISSSTRRRRAIRSSSRHGSRR